MIRLDEDALICDLAETYNNHNYRAYDADYIAILACGLGKDARIRQNDYTANELLLSGILDRLSLLVYSQTKDAAKGTNYPEMLTDKLINKSSDVQAYNSSEDFLKEREKILWRIQQH